jgi:L-ascorbate metabolism protein UlaG (beta-lactamase superfamily)
VRDYDLVTARTGVSRGRITWLGHSTVLLELDSVRLLTDPLLRQRIVHLTRVAKPPDPAALRDLDGVLLSHLHYDHLDLRSLRSLGRSVPIVAPVGAGRMLRRRGFGQITEVAVGDEFGIGVLAVRVTYAEHDARRSPFGTVTPAVGYVITGSAGVYFAGDTDLFDGMSTLAPALDVALLPTAGWGPRLPRGHLDPQRAAQALALLRPRVAVPIHWGTYRRIGLGRDPALLRAPAEDFAEFARELAPGVDVRILSVGGSLELGGSSGPDFAADVPEMTA